VLIALGIDAGGDKHVLGVREGATENSTSCKELLADLSARGLRTRKAILAVIDGSKALSKAIRTVFGRRVMIQRCRRTRSQRRGSASRKDAALGPYGDAASVPLW